MRSSPCDTVARFCARPVLCWLAFPSAPALGSTDSAADRSALFTGFTATMAGSDFSRSCITGPHMLPSTLLTVSASAELWFSRLNSTPHTITVYASQPPSPATTQHSLPGARYGLPGPDFHRLDHASFAWRTSNPFFLCGTMDCFASLAMTGCRMG